MKSLILLPLTLLSCCPTIARADAPQVSLSYQNTTLTLTQCQNRAENSLRASGFSRGLEVSGEFLAGINREYRGVIRCLIDKGIILFLVTGPESDAASNFIDKLEDNF